MLINFSKISENHLRKKKLKNTIHFQCNHLSLIFWFQIYLFKKLTFEFRKDLLSRYKHTSFKDYSLSIPRLIISPCCNYSYFNTERVKHILISLYWCKACFHSFHYSCYPFTPPILPLNVCLIPKCHSGGRVTSSLQPLSIRV